MKNKKIILAGILAVMMGLSLAGCGNDKKPANEQKEQTEETQQVTEPEEDDEEDVSWEDEEEESEDAAWEDDSEDEAEFVMPVQDDFTLAPGLSEEYADLDNRAFVYNGTKFTLGESTLKDLIDAGIPFGENDLNNSGNNVNKNYETERYTADINDYVTMQFKFANFTDSEQKAEDCVLSYVRYSHLYVPQPDYDADMNAEITEAMLDGAKQVHFSFPTTITKDELLEKCSENASESDNYVKYLVDSEVYMGSSGYQFQFNEVTNQLKEVSISWLP